MSETPPSVVNPPAPLNPPPPPDKPKVKVITCAVCRTMIESESIATSDSWYLNDKGSWFCPLCNIDVIRSFK